MKEYRQMADVITLEPKKKKPEPEITDPQPLTCERCGFAAFYIYPDSIVSCCHCDHTMELVARITGVKLTPD